MAKDIFTAEWFPYYFERFEGSDRVAAMSLAEEGAYHRAIRIAWKYGSVPSDPALLAARIQKRCSVSVAAKVLTTFEPMPGVPSRCIHPTVEQIRAEQKARAESTRERGRLGAEKRWGKTGETAGENSSAIAQPMQDIDRDLERDSDKESFSETDSCVRACVREFSDADPRLVEIGVIKTLIQHRNSPTAGPIRSVRYFREEIEDMVLNSKKLGTNAINAMLHSYRQKAEKMLSVPPALAGLTANGRN